MKKLIFGLFLFSCVTACTTDNLTMSRDKSFIEKIDSYETPNLGDEVEAILHEEETSTDRKIKLIVYCVTVVDGGWDAYGIDSKGQWYTVKSRAGVIKAVPYWSPTTPHC